MTGPATQSDASDSGAPVTRLAARLEDRFHRFRERHARRRGLTPIVIPYAGYGSTQWVRVLSRVLLARPGTVDEIRYKKIRGWRSFTSVPVGDSVVFVGVAGVEHTVTADRGGVVDDVIEVSLAPGWHTITMRTADSERVEAPVFIVDPKATIGLISDVDDTVMVTALPRPFLAAWNTFVLDEHARTPVAGMAVLFEKLVRDHPGSPVIYLSTGAWNVAPTLTRFLSRHLYPAGTLLLTDWGPTHDRWFRSGRAHKEESLLRLAGEFPDLKWILVGDDGQHDEDLYRTFALTHPNRVAAIAIRQLSGGEAVLAGGRSRPEPHVGDDPTPWVRAEDGAGLADELSRLGLL
ncbi:MAG: phosphatase domain-containing protein [Terrimesophilobacter sp.]